MHTMNEISLASFGMLAGVMAGMAVSAAMAHRWDVLLDRPGPRDDAKGGGSRRKLHQRETPMVGGVVLLAALTVALLVLPFPFDALWSLPFGLAALALLGLIDDLYDVPAQLRFLLQFLVAFVVVIFGGIEIQTLGNLLGFGPISLGPFAAPVTVLCIMLIVNAVNMLDGIDGLAGSVALVATMAFGVLAFSEGMRDLAIFSMLLVAGLLGFLVFNLRTPWRARASVFLGDSGSMMLGFWLAWMAVAITQMPGSGVAPATVALILIFPAGDLFGVFGRRLRLRRNPMYPDRGHTHHILIRAGCTVGQAVTLLILVYALWIGLAVQCHFRGCPEWLQFAVAAVVFLVYVTFILSGHRIIRWCRRTRRRTQKSVTA
jgi:UDP-GlcNAc:undecaprenyl-phosphate/decaprenyl-phosphate GlcNAc-1-phosphate transferase